MEFLRNGCKGLFLLLKLNSDRVLYIATVAFALGAGAFIGAQLLP